MFWFCFVFVLCFFFSLIIEIFLTSEGTFIKLLPELPIGLFFLIVIPNTNSKIQVEFQLGIVFGLTHVIVPSIQTTHSAGDHSVPLQRAPSGCPDHSLGYPTRKWVVESPSPNWSHHRRHTACWDEARQRRATEIVTSLRSHTQSRR